MTTLCPCGAELKGDSLCPACAHALQIAISDVSAYWCDLDTVKARQTRYGGTGGGRGGEKPLPVDARFLGWEADGSRLQEAVKNTMATWTQAVLEERPVFLGPVHPACLHVSCSRYRRNLPPRDDVSSVCRYLLRQTDWIRSQIWAPDILDELSYIAEQLRWIVDRPADKEYIGHCDTCGEKLYHQPGDNKAKCRHCGHEYLDALDRRAKVLDELDSHCLTAAEIEVAFTNFSDTPLTSARIRKWAQRKRIIAKGHVTVQGKQHPTYLVADVRLLVRQDSEQKAG